ncbi:helix-turn-helix transcriptional regulator [Anaerotruncus sp.]|uniref:helix-turn-helix domain-containing protein n=1 Tax=Anaerotruncus TaxID=244127 RepID=UPI002173B038|nr:MULTISPECIES: helix-turn-helix transcriptional regulator [Anaerotruncus]MCI8493999.1 helix-turn-helix transcriptional regulator [Anaerotruncus sp.]
MLTEFGKLLRKIRIDRHELLKEMADQLKVSSSYLSAVETGKRRIPKDWVKQISKIYGLSDAEQRILTQAANDTVYEVRISLQNASTIKKDAVLSFAKALDGLSDEELTKIMSTMKKKEGRKGDNRHA